jgi:hypothetical protein
MVKAKQPTHSSIHPPSTCCTRGRHCPHVITQVEGIFLCFISHNALKKGRFNSSVPKVTTTTMQVHT